MSKAQETRLYILQKAFELIYTKGYQATSIDVIIAATHVTKGAFFYHFKTKDDMGVAIIEEILRPTMLTHFIEPMKRSEDPRKDIYKMMKQLLFEIPELRVEYGCPAGNLTQEMTPWNSAFSVALSELIDQWKNALIASINKAKANGNIRKDIHATQTALFIMSGYWGIRNLGKLYNSSECYKPYLKELKRYLEELE
jgi:AcrR family transcriptional regulator